tara:strand:- start:764 stop:1753 length:990 start_codon:yes stop_codon:yes gene_type:complete
METIRQNIVSFGQKRSRPYAESSINTYLRNIRKIHGAIHPDVGEMKDMEWASDIKAVEGALSSFKSTTQRNYYNAIIIGLMAHPADYGNIQGIYEGKRDILNAEYEKTKGQPTEGQAKVLQYVNAETINNMIDGQRDAVKGNRMDYLVWCLFNIHRTLPFRNELAKIQVIQEGQYEGADKTQNYLVVGKIGKGKRITDHTLKFVLNDYKTAKKYGEKTIKIEDKTLHRDILDWIVKYINKDLNIDYTIPTYLFTWATGKPLLRNDISHLMSNYSSKLIGHSVSTTLMAKIFNEVPPGNTATEEQIKKLKDRAHARGHSVKVSASIYNPK